jgi:hypothetical protein
MHRGAGAVVGTAVTLTLLFSGQPAGASAPAGTAGTTTAPAGSVNHCVLRAGGGAPASGTSTTLVCFGSFRSAIAYATGGQIADAPESATQAATDPAFTAKLDEPSTLNSAVLGLEYADVNYGGGSLTLSAPTGCDNSSDVDWQFASLPSSWNDRISSFRSFSNCIQRLFRNVNFGVAITPATANMSWVGSAANDQASSIRFY